MLAAAAVVVVNVGTTTAAANATDNVDSKSIALHCFPNFEIALHIGERARPCA